MFPIWHFFIRKQQFTILLIIALVIGGILALVAIPKESAPEVQIPIAIVSTVLPGASATDIEQLVTDKLEDGLQNLENLDKITSSSREGLSSVVVQFDASADLDKSIQEVKDAVDTVKVKLPSEAKDPIVSDVNFSEQPILILSVSGNYLPAQLTALGDELSSDLQTLSGVSRVDVSGVQKHEVQVVVDTRKLSQYGISISDVTSAIQSANASLPIGSLSINGVGYALSFEGDIENPDEVASIPVSVVGGVPLYVRDVAEVTNGVAKAQTLARVSKDASPASPALTLNVYKSSGGNIVRVADAVKNRLSELQKDGTIAGDVVVAYDAGEEVNKDLTELTKVGLETIALVMLMLFLTIGWREAVVAGLSIPLSFLIAFIGLYASGNTINFVSLFSLILAIGILVDSGIVVTEAIHTRISLYQTKMEAALAALREYSWPLIAGTTTTIAVFVPLFFISGIVGQFIASIPFTLIFVLIASIVVALGLVPLLAIMFTPKKGHVPGKLEMLQEKYTHDIQEWYRKFLGKLLDNKKIQNRFLASLVVGFFVVMSLPVFGLIPAVFFPAGETDFVYIEIELPEGTELSSTDLAVRPIEEILYDDPNIESFVTTVGAGSAFSDSSGSGSKLANITVLLKDTEKREINSIEFAEKLREKMASINTAIIHVYEPSDGPPSGAPVLITFSSEDFDALDTATVAAEKILSGIEGATDITTSIKDSGTAFTLTIDKQKAALAGVSPALVAGTLRAAVNGTTATTIRTNGDDIDIVVKVALDPKYSDPNATNNAAPDALRTLTIPTRNGSILLGSILAVEISRAQATINHEDGERIQTISSYLKGDATAIGVTNEFKKQIEEIGIPSGVSMRIGGETEDIQRSFTEMGIAFLAGILLMLAILVLEFNSFRNTMFLLSVIPLSMIGIFLGLLILRQPLSFSSLLGIIALAGVIINHSIILMDSIHRLEEERPEAGHREIVIESGVSRLRPIILTTITTVVGMIPLLGVSSLWSPLATAIMFGLAFSTVLTLVLIPTLAYRWPTKKVT